MVNDSDQPKDYADPPQKAQLINFADSVVKGIGPGWILAFVVLVIAVIGTQHFEMMRRSSLMTAYLEMIETHRAEEIRRLQETIQHLADALTRRSNDATQ